MTLLYLGHIASGDRLWPNPEKVDAILKWPPCGMITEVQGFLNLAGYYCQFIQDFEKKASPMYKLLEGSLRCRSPIQWDDNCEQARTDQKMVLTSANLLVHLVPWHLFVMDTNTSGNCLGAVLQQMKDAFAGLGKGKEAGEQKDCFKFKRTRLTSNCLWISLDDCYRTKVFSTRTWNTSHCLCATKMARVYWGISHTCMHRPWVAQAFSNTEKPWLTSCSICRWYCTFWRQNNVLPWKTSIS